VPSLSGQEFCLFVHPAVRRLAAPRHEPDLWMLQALVPPPCYLTAVILATVLAVVTTRGRIRAARTSASGR
jgi:hypothetical protein